MKELYARVVTFDAGHDWQQIAMKDLFIIGQYYKVENVSMGQSITNIFLKGFKGCFNSVFFKFYVRDEYGKFVKHDIFADPYYNPYL